MLQNNSIHFHQQNIVKDLLTATSMQIGTTKFLSLPPPHTFHCYQNLHITTTSAQQQRSAFHCQIINKNNHYSMWSLVRASRRCPWSASFPKMIKYFVKKKNTLNNERYRDLLISILSYDEVSAFLLRVKTRN